MQITTATTRYAATAGCARSHDRHRAALGRRVPRGRALVDAVVDVVRPPPVGAPPLLHRRSSLAVLARGAPSRPDLGAPRTVWAVRMPPAEHHVDATLVAPLRRRPAPRPAAGRSASSPRGGTRACGGSARSCWSACRAERWPSRASAPSSAGSPSRHPPAPRPGPAPRRRPGTRLPVALVDRAVPPRTRPPSPPPGTWAHAAPRRSAAACARSTPRRPPPHPAARCAVSRLAARRDVRRARMRARHGRRARRRTPHLVRRARRRAAPRRGAVGAR